MFTKTFWSDAIERVVATMSQTLLALLTVDGVATKVNLDIKDILYTAGLAGVISFLKCIVALKSGGNSASFTIENVKQKGTV